MKKKKIKMIEQLSEAFKIDFSLNNRHEETNPSQTRRTVEDLLQIKKYKEMHEDFYE